MRASRGYPEGLAWEAIRPNECMLGFLLPAAVVPALSDIVKADWMMAAILRIESVSKWQVIRILEHACSFLLIHFSVLLGPNFF